jgi:peptidoglycan-N-acetylglucosamine deacetylase
VRLLGINMLHYLPVPEKIGNVYFHGSRDKRKLALTFDDGPDVDTSEVLDVLEENGARATFFVLGKKISGNEGDLERMKGLGCEIGSHGYSHRALWFMGYDAIYAEIGVTDLALISNGIESNLIRPPFMRFGLKYLHAAREFKKRIICADVFTNDWREYGKEKVIRNVLQNVRPGSIVSMHDYFEGIGRNAIAGGVLRELIPELKGRGYELATFSEVLV